jgi:putative PIN family toxin of toxin-antitoxin system
MQNRLLCAVMKLLPKPALTDYPMKKSWKKSMPSEMQKIVVDTNVIVSALIGSGYPSQIIFDLVLGKKVQVCTSADIFTEYIEVLNREKFSKYPEFVIKAEIVLNKIDELSLKLSPSIRLQVINDEPDNRFLELAVTAEANFLITGDKNDFLLSQYGSLQIVSPREYIEIHFG